jgi:DNA processing protein
MAKRPADGRDYLNSSPSSSRNLRIEAIPQASSKYPSVLRGIPGAPPFLFKRGVVSLNGNYAAVVGSRDPSVESCRLARRLCESLVGFGLSIVSGLALGIDTEAHKGALAFGGETIAVLGNDLNRIYPKSNEDLAQAIADNGALVSEHHKANPTPKNLVLRNRLISGLSQIVLVLEPERGSYRTIDYALRQGRLVFIFARLGGRRFLRGEDGAYMVDDRSFPSVEYMVESVIAKSGELGRDLDNAPDGLFFPFTKSSNFGKLIKSSPARGFKGGELAKRSIDKLS